MLYWKWSNILEKISHDRSLSGANVIEKIKKELQSYPAVYKEWENADQNTFKATLLCFAAGRGHIDVVKALLNAEGIDVRATNKAGWTALHCAVKAGHIDIAELLLINGADINAKTNRGAYTTLSLIIFLNDKKYDLLNDERCEEKVKFLLKKGANVNAVELFGRTPLHLAIEKDNLNVVKALLEVKEIDVNKAGKYGWTLLHHASLHGNKDIVELLLAKRADPNLRNDDKNVPLHYASSEGHINVVEALLKEGADVNAAGSLGWTSLHCASDKGYINVVEALLKEGADVKAVNSYGSTPLYYAAHGGHIKVVEALLKKGADVNVADKDGNTPLHMALNNGNLRVANFLLANGADVNAVNCHERSPLHYAAEKGSLEMVTRLLEKGAEVNAADENGKTPLHYAAEKGSVEVVTHLFERGADVKAADENGKTPLHRAALRYVAYEGRKEVLKALLGREANPVAYEGHIKVVEALLGKGANPIKVLNSYYYDKKLVNKEITKHLKKAKEKINREASNLFWAGCANKQEEAEKIIEFSKQEGRLAAILESGSWMQCLSISKEEAKELAKKDNKEIIKEIQTRQAIVIGFAGGVIAVFAIIAIATIILTASMPMTPGVITGIVAAGVLGCTGLLGIGFACYHVPKGPPSAEMKEVGEEQHVPESEPKKGATPVVPSA